MSIRLVSAALVVALTLTACQGAPGAGTGASASQAAKGQGIIRGTVTTAGVIAVSGLNYRTVLQANAAVPGAHLEITSGVYTGEATTNADGTFSVAVPGGAAYTVTASHPDGQGGMMKQIAVVTVPLADEPPVVDVASLVTRRTGSIQGVVTLADGADPEGVDVFVPGTTIVGKAGAKGRFALANLPEGTWNVVVQKAGYQRAALTNLSVQAGKPLLVAETVSLAKGDAEGGGVKALVRDASGKAIVGASYSLTSADGQTYTTISDAQGAVSLTGLPAGTYASQAYRAFYKVPTLGAVTVAAGQTTDAGTVALTANVVRFGQVKGQLLDEAGAPVDGAIVQLDPPTTEQVFTDSQGRFTLDRVMPGEYTLRASAGGYAVAERSVLVDNLPSFVADLADTLVMREAFDPAKPAAAGRKATDLLAPQLALAKQGGDVVLSWQPVGQPGNVANVVYLVEAEVAPNVFFPLTATALNSVTIPGVASLAATYRVTARPSDFAPAAGYRVQQVKGLPTNVPNPIAQIDPNALSADIYSFMSLFQKQAQQMRNDARQVRADELQNKTTLLQNAAAEIRNAAQVQMSTAVIQGSLQIAGGAVSIGAGTAMGKIQQSSLSGAKQAELNGKLSALGDQQVKLATTGNQISTKAGQTASVGSVGVAAVYKGQAQQLEADAKKAQLEADAKIRESNASQANDMMQQMMDVIRDVRDKLAAIQQSQLETTRGIARNI